MIPFCAGTNFFAVKVFTVPFSADTQSSAVKDAPHEGCRQHYHTYPERGRALLCGEPKALFVSSGRLRKIKFVLTTPAHHSSSTYFHACRVSIQPYCIRHPALAGVPHEGGTTRYSSEIHFVFVNRDTKRATHCCCCCCCCCSHMNSHNQVRGHRTGSSHSGAEEYPEEKHKQTKGGTRIYHS